MALEKIYGRIVLFYHSARGRYHSEGISVEEIEGDEKTEFFESLELEFSEEAVTEAHQLYAAVMNSRLFVNKMARWFGDWGAIAALVMMRTIHGEDFVERVEAVNAAMIAQDRMLGRIKD